MLNKLLKSLTILIKGGSIPIGVRINQEIPIQLKENLEKPLNTQVTVGFEDYVDIEANVPVNAEILVDTIVDADILKLGKIKIPIKAQIPISLMIPLSTRVKARLVGIPV